MTTLEQPVRAVPEPWRRRHRERLAALRASLAAVLLALVVGGALVLIAGGRPLAAYGSMLDGAFGSPLAIGQVLTQAVPLLVIGLGLALAFRARIYNIGAEGQLFMGALLGGVLVLTLPHGLGAPAIVLALLGGVVGGALWGGIVGGLRSRWGVNEVLTSLLLNYVAIFGFSFVVRKPFRDPAASFLSSESIPDAARLPLLPSISANVGVLIALALVPIVGYAMTRTPFGFRVRTMGLNPEAAEAAGTRVGSLALRLMLISGGLAGLAGVIQVLGVAGRLDPTISQNYGFTAIVVALLGRLRAGGVLLAALLIAALQVGGQAMSVDQALPYSIVLAIQGVFVVLLLIIDRVART